MFTDDYYTLLSFKRRLSVWSRRGSMCVGKLWNWLEFQCNLGLPGNTKICHFVRAGPLWGSGDREVLDACPSNSIKTWVQLKLIFRSMFEAINGYKCKTTQTSLMHFLIDFLMHCVQLLLGASCCFEQGTLNGFEHNARLGSFPVRKCISADLSRFRRALIFHGVEWSSWNHIRSPMKKN